MKTIKTITCVGSALALGASALAASEIEWTGNGDGSSWSDGSDIPERFQLACLTGDGWLDTDGPRGLLVIIR